MFADFSLQTHKGGLSNWNTAVEHTMLVRVQKYRGTRKKSKTELSHSLVTVSELLRPR